MFCCSSSTIVSWSSSSLPLLAPWYPHVIFFVISDEPTNHLDLEAVLWLEAHLQNYRHTIITVSHDRGFLNEICTDTIEFKDKKLTYYRGNYDNFVKLKKEKLKNQMRQYEAYKTKRDHMMEFIEKFRANAKRATIGKCE